MDITRALLSTYEGRNISTICTTVKFVDNQANHCAHFVNHLLEFAESVNCGQLMGRPGAAANVRVHEMFAQCPLVGEFAQRPTGVPCLAFVTKRSAVDLGRHSMVNIPKKHIGIFCDGEIWHYSNTADKVVRQTPDAFAQHYPGDGFGLFFGTFPAAAHAATRPAGPAAAQPPTLQRGLKDNIDVVVWQQLLILRGHLAGPDIHRLLDGDFGEMTEDATQAFQAAAGLAATGVVDAATYAAAERLGFIPRVSARAHAVVTHVTPEMTKAAIDALRQLGPRNVFYTELTLDAGGAAIVARLEPHKHTQGTQLRFWHRGITLYQGA